MTFSHMPSFSKIEPIPFSLPQNNSIEQLYLSKRKRAFIYQLTFITLGILFTTFASILGFKIANWSFHVLFFHGEINKIILHIMSCLSGVFGFASLLIGCSLRAEREAARALYQQAKERLLFLTNSPAVREQLEQIALQHQKMMLVLHQISACSRTKPSAKKELYLSVLTEYEQELNQMTIL